MAASSNPKTGSVPKPGLDKAAPMEGVPPPVTQATDHGVYPDMNHDERARFNFHACLYQAISNEVSPGNALAYEKRVLPAFTKENGREPETRHEVRHAMNNDPLHSFWGGLRRNTMEMRQVNGQLITLRQLEDLAARAEALNAGSPRLQLDPDTPLPFYLSQVDHHCMPGSYYRELVDGDVSPAANYDVGFFVTTGGSIGGLCDGGGKAVAHWLKTSFPDLQPKRILDIGCALGNSLCPIAKAFPDAEITAIDISAPMLRYGHARAKSLGIENITFIQANAEDLSRFDNGSFDFVMTSIFLHELSSKSLPRLVREAARVLADGGLMLHLEQPQYDDNMPVYEQFMRDWDAYNNNEPFWSAMHEIDLVELFSQIGFDKAKVTMAALQGIVDRDDAAASGASKEGEHGRAPSWHAYVAQK